MEDSGADPGRWPRSIGILGAAALSVPITRRLLRVRVGAVRISIFAQQPDGLAELVQLGAASASSPADLAARSQIVISLLDSLEETEAMLAGPRGLPAGVHSPTILVVGTDLGPTAVALAASRLSGSTAGLLRVVDVPIGGTAAEADQGRLSIPVGLGPEAYAGLRPVLRALSASRNGVPVVGVPGDGPGPAGVPEAGSPVG